MSKVQFSTLICGVGPAERTGKSIVTYCPGGSRIFGVCCCRLDLKPREIGVLSMEGVPLLREPSQRRRLVMAAPQSVHSAQPRRPRGRLPRRSISAVHLNNVWALERVHLQTGVALFSRAFKSTINTGHDHGPRLRTSTRSIIRAI